METFFFLSLGITFVLILLLVYHFKQRLTTVEAKRDTMFDIMNTMVKEMGVIKAMASRPLSIPTPFSMPPGNSISLDQVFSQMGGSMQMGSDTIDITTLHDKKSHQQIANESDSDDEESGSDDESSSDEEEEDSENEEETKPFAANEFDDKIVVSDTEDLVEDVLEEVIDETTKPSSPSNIPLTTEDLVEPHLVEEIPIDRGLANSAEINADTDDMSVISELSLDNTLDTQSKTATDFRKMNLGELKQLALSKGLVQDAGKMKKKELLELLRTTVA